VGERLEALDRHAGSLVPCPPVELDAEQAALAGLCRCLERGGSTIVECRGNKLAAAVAERRHHVASALGGGAPPRFLDETGHARPNALAFGYDHLGDLGEGPRLVSRQQVA